VVSAKAGPLHAAASQPAAARMAAKLVL